MLADEDTELRDLVAQTLETTGVLGKIRAELRASVFLALEEQNSRQKKSPFVNQELNNFLNSDEGHLAACLVKEFLEFFNLDYTAAVFNPETNLGDRYTGRDDLRKRLKLNQSESKKPLLAELLKPSKKEEQTSEKLSSDHDISLPEKLTDPQIEDARKKFDHYDKDNSGEIDKDELRSLFLDIFPHFHRNMLDRYVNDEFQSVDKDFNSGISFDEFLGMYKRLFILCRGVVAHSVDDLTPSKTFLLTPDKQKSDDKDTRQTSNGKGDDISPTVTKPSASPDRQQPSSKEIDDFFDEPLPGSRGNYSANKNTSSQSSSPKSPSKGLSSLSDAPSLLGPSSGGLMGPSLVGSGGIMGQSGSPKQAPNSPDWKDLDAIDSKIAKLGFGDTTPKSSPRDKDPKERSPGDGKRDQEADDYEDDFLSSSQGTVSRSPSQLEQSHRSRVESQDNSISEDIPEDISGDDDFLASSQDKMDDLTMDRTLSEMSQGGGIDYIEDVQLT